MKKHYYALGTLMIALLAFIAVLPAIARAEDGSDDEAEVEIEQESEIESGQNRGPGGGKLRDALRARTENIELNEGVRNKLLGKIASTTRMEIRDIRRDGREEMKDVRVENRMLIKSATTSQERRELRKDLRKDQFEAHKNILVRQLNLALSNLKQIRNRIAERIAKAESSGRDMTKAKAALVTADAKITVAGQAIATVASFSPTATTTATTTIDLTRPRQLGETAIKAVNEAKKALVDVVTAIARAMGLKIGVQATTTTSVGTTTDDTDDDNDSDDDSATTTDSTATTTDSTATSTTP